MKVITFYFDVISPYAYLAFKALPQTLAGHSVVVNYQPVVFGALLKQAGQLGPAEIPGKRTWTYRQVLWQARALGLPLRLPAAHPFNSLGLQRLLTACDAQGLPNRYAVSQAFELAWNSGLDPASTQAIAQLQAELQPLRDPAGEEVKLQLRQHTDQALQAGVFGVPTLVLDGQLFWGSDALPMVRAYLDGESWFASTDWVDADKLPWGVRRS